MLNEFIIKGTEDTPDIRFNAETGILEISGRSMPENVNIVFQPTLEWVEEYTNNPHPSTEVIFRLEYFSSASAKKIIELLLLLEKLISYKHKINITWFHLKDDEVMENRGRELLSLINIPSELKVM